MKKQSTSSHRTLLLSLFGAGLTALAGCANNDSNSSCCRGGSCHSKSTPATISPAIPPAAPSSVSPPTTPPAAPSSIATPATQPAAGETGQKSFATPDEAAQALQIAAAAGDRQALLDIFGPDGQQLVFSGDPVEEANGMKKFAAHLAEYLRVDQETPGKAVLYIGLKNWPFPIPVVKSDKGWSFDTAAGKEELLDRRIGANETNAISVCRAYVAAQKEYARLDPMGVKTLQYAQHFRSSEGKKDGLFWAVGDGEQISPMGPLVAEAQSEGYLKDPQKGKHEPYKGYLFHILTGQGDAAPGGKMSYLVDGRLVKGFAMVAWPDSWGASGVMTFIVNHDGKVYQKNLGEKTAQTVKEISEYNPDETWTEVKD